LKALTIQELEDFTLESYTRLLQYLSEIYSIVPFCKIPTKDVPYLILRHDIDISLPAALEMAKIERDLGIRSTYFVLFSGRFYNLLEGDNVNVLRQISQLGHEVGLHYHSSQYRSYSRSLERTLKIEVELLEHFLDKKVHSIARHSSWERDPFATIKKYINANHPRLQRDLYIHESCRAWTPSEGLFKLLNDPPRRVQLLTHPENWQKDKIDRETLLERHIQNLEKEIITLKNRIKTVYETDPLVLKYDALIKKRNFMQFHSGRHRSDPALGSILRQELGFHNTLFRWYMINTSLGWRLHKIIEKIRNISNTKKLTCQKL